MPGAKHLPTRLLGGGREANRLSLATISFDLLSIYVGGEKSAARRSGPIASHDVCPSMPNNPGERGAETGVESGFGLHRTDYARFFLTLVPTCFQKKSSL